MAWSPFGSGRLADNHIRSEPPVTNAPKNLTHNIILTTRNTISEGIHHFDNIGNSIELTTINSLKVNRPDTPTSLVPIEYKIINNQLVDHQREAVIQSLYPNVKGIEYTPFEATTIGLGYHVVGDMIDIVDDNNVTHNCLILGIKRTLDGSMKEVLYCRKVQQGTINYKTSGGLDNAIKRTELEVDKQNQQITATVEQNDDNNSRLTNVIQNVNDITQTVQDVEGDINTINDETHNLSGRIVEITTDLNGVVNNITRLGGANLIKNSVFLSYDADREPDFWEKFRGTNKPRLFASQNAVNGGSISGHVILLDDIGFSQEVTVAPDLGGDDEDKNYYSLSCLVSKAPNGSGFIQIEDGTNSHIVNFTSSDEANWVKVSLPELLATTDTFTVKIYGSAGSNFQVTDLILVQSKYPSNWQQAKGETLNTEVKINEKGIIVNSTTFMGDYTIISPVEFSGYSNVGGISRKVFTLNKDRTEVKKLKAEDEIIMGRLKLVAIDSADNKGWAFVKANEQ